MRVISPLSTVRQLCSMVHRRKMNGFEKQEILPCSYLRRLSILHYLLTLPNLFSRNLSWTKLIVQSDTNSRPRRDKISFYYKYRGYIYIYIVKLSSSRYFLFFWKISLRNGVNGGKTDLLHRALRLEKDPSTKEFPENATDAPNVHSGRVVSRPH